jgi:uncharacterized sulfatase
VFYRKEMTIKFQHCLIGCFVLLLAATASADDKFQSLFNGKDLSGWQGLSGFWSVQDGTIVGETTKQNPTKANTFLVWQGGDVGDFVFKTKVRFRGNNSGVQYRSELVDAQKFVVKGYQADLHKSPEYFGMLYAEKWRGIVAKRFQKVEVGKNGKPQVVGEVGDREQKLIDTQWNELTIIAVGDRQIHQVNGVTTMVLTDNHPEAKRSGILALQLHRGPPMKVEFKDIQLRKLAGDQAKSVIEKALNPPARTPAVDSKPSTAKKRPDIVFYIADDLSAADLPLHGGTNIQTPSIDALAASGMTFDRAFVASPSCASSRAALLTGLMPAKNGAEENHSYPRKDVLKLPQVLNKLGYQTAAFGKVAHLRSAPDYHFEVHNREQHIPEVRKNVNQFLESRTDERPLALFVGVSDPHVPWPSESTVDAEKMTLPPKLLDTPQTRVQRSRYLQEVKDLDAFLGELRALTDEHLSQDHVFVFSSDHGAQFPFGKWTLYDEGIRVPLIVAQKGKIKAGSRTKAMVSWIDILPTLIDMVGGDVPKKLDGRSFTNVLNGNTDSHRSNIFTTHSGDQLMNVYLSRSIRNDRYKLIWNPHTDFAFTTHIDMLLRETSGDYFKQWTERAQSDPAAAATVAKHHGRPSIELYDLQQDPDEIKNLAGQPEISKIQQQLFEDLKKWIATQDDQLTVFHEPLMLDAPKTWVPRKRKRPKKTNPKTTTVK